MYEACVRLGEASSFALGARFALAKTAQHYSRWEYLGSPEQFDEVGTGQLAAAHDWMEIAPVKIYTALEHLGVFVKTYLKLSSTARASR